VNISRGYIMKNRRKLTILTAVGEQPRLLSCFWKTANPGIAHLFFRLFPNAKMPKKLEKWNKNGLKVLI